jgi:hypothetical protein
MVIDPMISYSAYLGGTGVGVVTALARWIPPGTCM